MLNLVNEHIFLLWQAKEIISLRLDYIRAGECLLGRIDDCKKKYHGKHMRAEFYLNQCYDTKWNEEYFKSKHGLQKKGSNLFSGNDKCKDKKQVIPELSSQNICE